MSGFKEGGTVPGPVPPMVKIPRPGESTMTEKHEPDPKKLMGDLKTPLQLLPTVFQKATANALKCGADKYGTYNWRKGDGVEAMTYIGAMRRHLNQFIDGEDFDDESGESHLGHIAAGCAILLDAMRMKKLIDNRPKALEFMESEEQEQCSDKTIGAVPNPYGIDAPSLEPGGIRKTTVLTPKEDLEDPIPEEQEKCDHKWAEAAPNPYGFDSQCTKCGAAGLSESKSPLDEHPDITKKDIEAIAEESSADPRVMKGIVFNMTPDKLPSSTETAEAKECKSSFCSMKTEEGEVYCKECLHEMKEEYNFDPT